MTDADHLSCDIIYNMDINQAIDQYLLHLEIEKGRSRHTLESYSHYLNRFESWADQHNLKSAFEITTDHILSYRQYLNRLVIANGLTLSKRTQNYHVVALRAWFKYLRKRNLANLPSEQIELAKLEPKQIQFLESEELQRLMGQPDEKANSGLRDMAIMHLLFSTGLRVSELAGLDRETIAKNRDEFSVIGKGRKERLVFVSPEAKNIILRYLETRTDNDKAAFIRQRETPGKTKTLRLSARSIERIISSYAKQAGITKKVTPHTLRHSFATDLLTNGANIRDVQEMLGHSSLATTQIYTHVTNKRLKNVHAEFHDKIVD